jgi:hypothetical protein
MRDKSFKGFRDKQKITFAIIVRHYAAVHGDLAGLAASRKLDNNLEKC